MKVIQFFKFALYKHKDILSKIKVHILRKVVTVQVFKRQLTNSLGGSHTPGILGWKCTAGTMLNCNSATLL